MKIFISQIPPEGLFFTEDISAEKLDLDTVVIKFRGFIQVKAEIFKINNALTVDLDIKSSRYCLCSRCIEEFELPFAKRVKLSYFVDRTIQSMDLDSDIREEIILEYPLVPLCKPDCRGLCFKC